MINPLDLPGPQFLLFYLLVGIGVLVALRLSRVAAEGGAAPRVETVDPDLLAYLRGGKNEALRIAAVSLVDRGLLAIDDKDQLTARAGADQIAERAIERAILRHFKLAQPATDIFSAADLTPPCDEYHARLSRVHLLPDDATRRARNRRLGLALIALVGLAGAKIWIALGRGRTNVGFLIALAIILVVIAVRMSRPFRTARGNALLADLRTLFRRLKGRAGSIRPGGATSEAVLLAAVFGLGALPAGGFAFAKRLYPKAAGDSGGSCGSSCGSSCGGGGGGGGCGGCGGGGGD